MLHAPTGVKVLEAPSTNTWVQSHSEQVKKQEKKLDSGIEDLGWRTALWTWEPPHPILFFPKMQLHSVQLPISHARKYRLAPHATPRRPHLVYSLKNLQLPPQVWLVSAPKRKWLKRHTPKEFKYQDYKTLTFWENSFLITFLFYPYLFC